MSPSLRVIVADDVRSHQHLLRSFLEKLGHAVLAVVDSGEELVSAHEQYSDQVQLLVADIKMAGISGIDAAREINLARADDPLPIVITSMTLAPEVANEAFQIPGVVFVRKDMSGDDLHASIVLAQRRVADHQSVCEARKKLKNAQDRQEAKFVLVKETGITDNFAFVSMQRVANETGTKLRHIFAVIARLSDIVKQRRVTLRALVNDESLVPAVAAELSASPEVVREQFDLVKKIFAKIMADETEVTLEHVFAVIDRLAHVARQRRMPLLTMVYNNSLIPSVAAALRASPEVVREQFGLVGKVFAKIAEAQIVPPREPRDHRKPRK